MVYNLIETTPTWKCIVRGFASLEEALSYITKISDFYEEDQYNPGCYDLVTKSGNVLSLEPVLG